MSNELPKDTFFWGAASSAHQVEGGNTNNDSWLLEHVAGSRYRMSSGDACDHFNRYREDLAILRDLGLDSYRFSVEWSRIEPADGEFSDVALRHYASVVAACVELGLRPIVCLHHFTTPLWLMRMGGWECERMPERFARFVERTARALGDRVSAYITINEANFAWFCRVAGVHPPDDEFRRAEWWTRAAAQLGILPQDFSPFCFTATERSRAITLESHRRAVDVLKRLAPHVPRGLSLLVQDVHSRPGGEALAESSRTLMHGIYLDSLRAAEGDDFVGVQNYGRMVFHETGAERPSPPTCQIGLEIYPQGLGGAIRDVWRATKLPILVSENGIATEVDSERIAYIRESLNSIDECVAQGIDVRGYLHWSIMDNFEWTFGFEPKMGLCSVDRSTMARSPKPSARWLGSEATRRRG